MQTDEVPFSHHEPCPRCGSKDNLGVWKDGHKYCFGCRYYERSPDNIENLKRHLMDYNNNNNTVIFDLDDYTYEIPEVGRNWLHKYGVTDGEINHYHILWNKKTDSLVFPIMVNSSLSVTSERYFGNNPLHPKYITRGNKNNSPLFLICGNNSHNIVFVEDYVSAIKVGRFVSVCPILGATVPAFGAKQALARFQKIRIWLDMDKASQSLLEASKLSQYGADVSSIFTPLDPKEYSNEELITILKDHKVLNFNL